MSAFNILALDRSNDSEIEVELGAWKQLRVCLLRGLSEEQKKILEGSDLLEENLQKVLRAYDRGTLARVEMERARYESRIGQLRGSLERLRMLAEASVESDKESRPSWS